MTATCGDLSRCLSIRDGQVQLDIPDGTLPGFLIEAFNAAQTGCLDRAKALLDEPHLQVVERLEQEGHPATALVFLVLGMTFQRLGLLKTAAGWHERAAALEPHPLVWAELATIYDQLMLYGQALTAIRTARSLDPENPQWTLRLPHHLAMAGRVTEAVDLLKAQVEGGNADAACYSSLLFYLHYVLEVTSQELLAEHLHWGCMYAPSGLARQAHDRDLDPDRRLRVGYVSADFRQHSAAYTFEAVLDGRRSEAVEVYGYGNVASPDAVTERLAGKFDHYRSIYGVEDKAVAERIEQDRIDILVAMAGHTSGHRLRLFAYRPAPIQVDLGSINTLGMGQIDYRLTDEVVDPPSSQAWYVEKLVYIQGGCVCYRPPDSAPPVGPLPALRQGAVTFAVFNNSLKIHDSLIALWCEVLRAVPDSRLVLKFPGSHDPTLVRSVMERFSRHWMGPERVSFLGYCRQSDDHYTCYQGVDMALDTYPFNGAITTLEALWMGVPVVTLAGDRFISRTGLGILHRLGMESLVATNPEDYVTKAVALAGHLDALSRIRGSLRRRMQASPLCDSRRFAGSLEAAYRWMWRQWCENQIRNQKSEIKNMEPKALLNSAFSTQHSELLGQGGHGP